MKRGGMARRTLVVLVLGLGLALAMGVPASEPGGLVVSAPPAFDVALLGLEAGAAAQMLAVLPPAERPAGGAAEMSGGDPAGGGDGGGAVVLPGGLEQAGWFLGGEGGGLTPVPGWMPAGEASAGWRMLRLKQARRTAFRRGGAVGIEDVDYGLEIALRVRSQDARGIAVELRVELSAPASEGLGRVLQRERMQVLAICPAAGTLCVPGLGGMLARFGEEGQAALAGIPALRGAMERAGAAGPGREVLMLLAPVASVRPAGISR